MVPSIDVSGWVWTAFLSFIALLLALDLGVFQRRAHQPRFREALMLTTFWVLLAISFNIWIYFQFGSEKALEFLAGYVVEQSLSVDNIFVFIIIFEYFRVQPQYQHRVLFYGILGAIIMRGIFIFLGVELIHRFSWVLYLFGILLIIAGARMLKKEAGEVELEKNFVLRMTRKFIRTTSRYHEQSFIVREGGKLFATPLLTVLILIEMSDVVFALDSLPAVFGITTDPFIVFTSNIFAILGLRSLFSVLSKGLAKLEYLRYGLAAVLIFVGLKLLLGEVYKIPTGISLLVIVLLLGTTIGFSVAVAAKRRRSVPVEAAAANTAMPKE